MQHMGGAGKVKCQGRETGFYESNTNATADCPGRLD